MEGSTDSSKIHHETELSHFIRAMNYVLLFTIVCGGCKSQSRVFNLCHRLSQSDKTHSHSAAVVSPPPIPPPPPPPASVFIPQPGIAPGHAFPAIYSSCYFFLQRGFVTGSTQCDDVNYQTFRTCLGFGAFPQRGIHCFYFYVRVCVCVRKVEREREREGVGGR